MQRLNEIDFVKGIAILSVLLLHTLSQNVLDVSCSSIHIGQAVPVFLFISFFLSFKGLGANKDNVWRYYYSNRKIKRIVKDVVIPFFVVVVLQIVLRLLVNHKRLEISDLFVGWGGAGPGNYYFWIYIQLWLLIPIIFMVLNKLRLFGAFFVLFMSIILNVICDVVPVSSQLYRLLFFRYLFLSVPAYLLYENENNNKKKFSLGIIICVIISVIYLIWLKDDDLSPLILDLGWSGEQWPSYFWTYMVVVLLIGLARKISGTSFCDFIEVLGRNSWYIFLAQMFVLSLINISLLGFIHNEFLKTLFFTVIISIISIIPALIANKIKSSKLSDK